MKPNQRTNSFCSKLAFHSRKEGLAAKLVAIYFFKIMQLLHSPVISSLRRKYAATLLFTWKLRPSASRSVSRRTPAFLNRANPLRTPRLWSAQSRTSFMSVLSFFTSATVWSWSESQP